MANVLVALGVGLLFGVGLIVSGMADPARVLGFLDVAGLWNPSLALVMAGAVAVGLAAFAVARRRGRTLGGAPVHWPPARGVDARLLGGSVLFGIGWGIAGFCPGPALVGLGMGLREAAVFVAAMLAGMAVFELLERLRARR
ncbi:hypothetical protein M4R22_09805 [Acidovorax sp. GBBC 3334]|uniref:DUF6691 family protein n=1 Tax=unclassified Acidovorax TaxID=2684926 RepID=UPI002303947A|nr:MULTISPECIES: DUF6691 family protein [unclassified Acidovorax]MDA8455059.1 hypothetical protein [Acidovorax sp. GBBC 3334]MDA8523427.1 hypothetical protein [Acidovorax sp. NCPPB 4044]